MTRPPRACTAACYIPLSNDRAPRCARSPRSALAIAVPLWPSWPRNWRVGARSLGPDPSLSVMSHIELAYADHRPVQRTGLGDRRRGMPVDAADERSADAGQIPPDLGRPMRLLVHWAYGLIPGRVGRGVRRDALYAAARGDLAWLSFGVRPRRPPWRGVAQEGSVLLKEALPSRLSASEARDGGWHGRCDHRDGPA